MAKNAHPSCTPAVSEECRLYTMAELAQTMGVSQRYIQILRGEGAPFAMGRSRPDWLIEWVKNCAFQQAPPKKLPEKVCV